MHSHEPRMKEDMSKKSPPVTTGDIQSDVRYTLSFAMRRGCDWPKNARKRLMDPNELLQQFW